jgi:hypothetical protein
MTDEPGAELGTGHGTVLESLYAYVKQGEFDEPFEETLGVAGASMGRGCAQIAPFLPYNSHSRPKTQMQLYTRCWRERSAVKVL